MVYAIFNYPDNGRDSDIEYAKEQGLVEGQRYEMSNASVGQSHSNVYLKNFEGFFNSIQFDYVDEHGNAVDIYRNPAYSPYCQELIHIEN